MSAPDFASITPHLVVSDAPAALEFYKKAFDAIELYRLENPKDGKIIHAEILIGNARLMLAEENKEWGSLSPKSLNGSSVTIHLTVPNVDEIYPQAVAAGAKATMPVSEMFWGDRYGKLVDPFGHNWSISTKVKEVSPEEMKQAFEKEFCQPTQ